MNMITSFLFTITLQEEAKRNYAHAVKLQDREKACSTPHACNSFGPLSQGYCERKTL